jgi:hypothetical protein
VSFVPASALEQCIVEGDRAGVLALLEAMAPPARADLAPRLVAIADLMGYWWFDRTKVHAGWGMPTTQAQREALAACALVCWPPEEAARCHLSADIIEHIVARFAPAGKERLAAAYARTGNLAAALRLGRAGLSPYTLDEAGLLELMKLPSGRVRDVEAYLVEHIEDLREPLLRMLEVEGTGDVNLASIDKYHKRMTWVALFHMLCERGVYSRAELIERCLATLEWDWPQFRAGWFSRLHDSLAPSAAEMAPHAGQYCALLRSRIPPTVSLALKAVAALAADGRLAHDELVEALEPVMTSSTKGHITAALKLLDGACSAAPANAPRAASLAVAALQHPAADVQETALRHIGKWKMGEAVRLELGAMAPHVAPSLQGQLATLLTGHAAPRTRRAPVVPAPREPLSPLAPEHRVQPVTDIDDLVALCGRVLEDDSEPDNLERAIQALCTLLPMTDEGRRRLAPVAKRARKLVQRREAKGAIAREFARLVVFAADGVHLRCVWNDGSAAAMLGERIDDTIAFAGACPGLVPLDGATHRRGFIDPDVLAERIGACQARGLKPPPGMRERALLRRAPGAPLPDSARASPQQPVPEGEQDEGLMLYRASLVPGNLEAIHAQGVVELSSNLKWSEARWYHKAYVRLLIAPTTPMTPTAELLLGLALLGKEPGQLALAVDAFVAASVQGRMQPAGLGRALASLAGTPMLMANRLTAALEHASRAAPDMPACVLCVIVEMLTHIPPVAPPAGLAGLLRLCLEIVTGHGFTLDAEAMAAMRKLELKGKAKTLMVNLIAAGA